MWLLQQGALYSTKFEYVKRNPGRPVSIPDKPVVTLTLRVTKEFKEKLIKQASAVDLTLTAYIQALVERDGA